VTRQNQLVLRGVEKAVEIFLPSGKNASNTNSPPDSASDPTAQIYTELLAGWRHFNRRLFGNRLRPCIITLRCSVRSSVFYAQQRFQTRDGTIIVDEIALNPESFHARSVTDTLSSLFHEQLHGLQFQYGHPSDGGYHNKEWAEWMERIGLIPSDTEKEGGRKTGVHMSHYIEPDGPFARACADLIARGIGISFIDRWAAMAKADPGSDPAHDKKQARRKSKAASKTRFSCPNCGQRARGKPSLEIDCRRCRQPMTA
jgi:hypothetical protein